MSATSSDWLSAVFLQSCGIYPVKGCFEAPQQAIVWFGLAYQPFQNSTFNAPLAWQKFQLRSFKNLAASCLVSPQMPAGICSVVPVPVPQKKCQPREVLLQRHPSLEALPVCSFCCHRAICSSSTGWLYVVVCSCSLSAPGFARCSMNLESSMLACASCVGSHVRAFSLQQET